MTEAPGAHPQHNLHILTVLVENRFGVLSRIAGLFSRRGFNIFSLAVAPTDDVSLSRISIVVDVHNTDVTQIAKQLDKLVNVLEITELQPASSIERELMLARVSGKDAQAVEQLLTQYGGSIVDSNGEELIVSLHAHPDQLDLCETGRIALGRLSG